MKPQFQKVPFKFNQRHYIPAHVRRLARQKPCGDLARGEADAVVVADADQASGEDDGGLDPVLVKKYEYSL